MLGNGRRINVRLRPKARGKPVSHRRPLRRQARISSTRAQRIGRPLRRAAGRRFRSLLQGSSSKGLWILRRQARGTRPATGPMHADRHAHARAHARTRTQARTYTQIHTRTRTYTHARTLARAQKHTHTHTHARSLNRYWLRGARLPRPPAPSSSAAAGRTGPAAWARPRGICGRFPATSRS